MTRTLALALAVAALMAPQAAALRDDFAPLAVVATKLDTTHTRLSWAPGPVQADYYLVYGIHNGTYHPIGTVLPNETVDDEHLIVQGYEAYAVSGVLDEVESDRVRAVSGTTEPCIFIGSHGVVIKCVPIIGGGHGVPNRGKIMLDLPLLVIG